MHHVCGSSSVGRASAFQAECREFESRLPLQFARMSPSSSGVERILGKDEVAGSIPALGSIKLDGAEYGVRKLKYQDDDGVLEVRPILARKVI